MNRTQPLVWFSSTHTITNETRATDVTGIRKKYKIILNVCLGAKLMLKDKSKT